MNKISVLFAVAAFMVATSIGQESGEGNNADYYEFNKAGCNATCNGYNVANYCNDNICKRKRVTCNTETCLAVVEFSVCSATCDGGFRTRNIQDEGGNDVLETQFCNTNPCQEPQGINKTCRARITIAFDTDSWIGEYKFSYGKQIIKDFLEYLPRNSIKITTMSYAEGVSQVYSETANTLTSDLIVNIENTVFNGGYSYGIPVITKVLTELYPGVISENKVLIMVTDRVGMQESATEDFVQMMHDDPTYKLYSINLGTNDDVELYASAPTSNFTFNANDIGAAMKLFKSFMINICEAEINTTILDNSELTIQILERMGDSAKTDCDDWTAWSACSPCNSSKGRSYRVEVCRSPFEGETRNEEIKKCFIACPTTTVATTTVASTTVATTTVPTTTVPTTTVASTTVATTTVPTTTVPTTTVASTTVATTTVPTTTVPTTTVASTTVASTTVPTTTVPTTTVASTTVATTTVPTTTVPTTPRFESTIPVIPDNVTVDCDRCDYTRGQIWRPDVLDCQKYYICNRYLNITTGLYRYEHFRMLCGTLFWDQERLTCVAVRPAGATCVLVGDNTYVRDGTTTFAPCPYHSKVNSRYYGSHGNDDITMDCGVGFIFQDSVCTCLQVAPRDCNDTMLLHFPFTDHFDDITCKKAHGGLHGPGYAEIVFDADRNRRVAYFNGHERLEVRFMRNWFKDQDITKWTVMMYFKHEFGNFSDFGLVDNGDCEDSSSFRIHGSQGTGITTNVNAGINSDDTANIDIDEQQWNHVALVYDNGSVTMYLNGVPESTTSTGAILNTQNPMTVAMCECMDGINKGYFRGRISELRVYTRALSPPFPL